MSQIYQSKKKTVVFRTNTSSLENYSRDFGVNFDQDNKVHGELVLVIPLSHQKMSPKLSVSEICFTNLMIIITSDYLRKS